jgi:hypothetical protein
MLSACSTQRRRRLHVAGLAEYATEDVPRGGQHGDELEGVLGAARHAPHADAAVLVRREHAPARRRQRLHGPFPAVAAEAREAAQVGLLPRHDVGGGGRAEQELAAEGEAGHGARVLAQHGQRLPRPADGAGRGDHRGRVRRGGTRRDGVRGGGGAERGE